MSTSAYKCIPASFLEKQGTWQEVDISQREGGVVTNPTKGLWGTSQQSLEYPFWRKGGSLFLETLVTVTHAQAVLHRLHGRALRRSPRSAWCWNLTPHSGDTPVTDPYSNTQTERYRQGSCLPQPTIWGTTHKVVGRTVSKGLSHGNEREKDEWQK